ncbi:MAG TPA: phospholipid carrier-dependent glycosyltransferase [Vicinamibacteria bacterium]|nr:phospholipid carrier-dependent glycosyltransferase [Vicinamibacteria bacterium]
MKAGLTAFRSCGLLVLILALAAALRVWGMAYGLPHTRARPDEDAVVNKATRMLVTGDHDPRYFDYPSLPFYLYEAALWSTFQAGRASGRYDTLQDFQFDIAVLRPNRHYLICRAFSVILAVLTVAATYWLGRNVGRSDAVGLVSALAASTAYVHVVTSRFAIVDVSMTLFVTLALVFAVRAVREQRLSDYVLAGIALGLAASTKYNAALVSLSLAIPSLAGMRDLGRIRAMIGRLAAAGLASIVVFSLTSPYVLLRPSDVHGALAKLASMLYGANEPRGFLLHLETTLPYGLGWPVFLLSLAGVFRALWFRGHVNLALLSFLLPFYALVGSVRLVFPRYVLPIIPILVVLGAEVFVRIVRRWRLPAAVAACIGIVLPSLVSSLRFDRIAAREDTRVEASKWVANHLPRRSRIAVCGGYGAPDINSDRRRPPAFEPLVVPCRLQDVRSVEAPYLVAHDHPYLSRNSHVPTELVQWLNRSATRLAIFDPFRGNGETPVFYVRDAFYLPYTGLGAVERGGPLVTVWRID